MVEEGSVTPPEEESSEQEVETKIVTTSYKAEELPDGWYKIVKTTTETITTQSDGLIKYRIELKNKIISLGDEIIKCDPVRDAMIQEKAENEEELTKIKNFNV